MRVKPCQFFLSVLLSLSPITLFAQGSLTPPGPPAMTMKSLDQVEARTIVNATNTPGDATNLFIITASGSYYLTGNITGESGKNGISIRADNVTLDLNGFALVGVSGSLRGILVSGTHRTLRIRNGTVQSWGNYGIDCRDASNSQFDHLLISQCSGSGLRCGAGCVLNTITADGSIAGNGITTGDRCVVTACSATGNLIYGLDIGSYCTVTASIAVGNFFSGLGVGHSCTVIGCTLSANSDSGLIASVDNTIKDCTVTRNGWLGIRTSARCLVVNCTANGNGTAQGSDGIMVGAHSTVKLCNASNNTLRGIEAAGDCLVLENQANNNTSDGILANGSINRIENNHTNYNGGWGINAGSDWVVRNTSSNNTSGNFNPATGPDIAPIQTASTATNPYANLQ